MIRAYVFYTVAILFILFLWRISPPSSFPTGSIVTIPEGNGLHTLSLDLEEDKIIRSPFWFRITAIILGGERRMQAGEYSMEKPQNAAKIAWRIVSGRHEIEVAKITVPEGWTSARIAGLFDERFQFFDRESFEKVAPEGYLFPDTYFMPVTATASTTIKLMTNNFVRKTKNLKITAEDTIIMASLIEGEANNQNDRVRISDVLWKRLKLGMPLQVDVEMKTYEFPGLPAKPINNPGLDSIKAALHPTTTPYLYYLTGDDGVMYYSRTFDEHVAKKLKYIR